MAKRNATPIYLQIAVDVAGRIARKELLPGQKISGRTTLASEYNVSPETIRKAMRLLSEVNIIEVIHGKGLSVSSACKAEAFIERFRIKSSVNDLKEEMIDLIKERDSIEFKMNETMNAIIDYTSRFKHNAELPINEYSLDYDTLTTQMTISELDLKRKTGVTLLAIKRDGHIMISPDEEEVLKSKDKLQYVGTASSIIRLGEYLREVFEEC